MDIQEKLDSIQQRKQELLNMRPDEKQTKEIKTTYDTYISAKEINEYAPSQLEEAKVSYYKAKYGVNYKDKLKEQYKVESKDIADAKLKEHESQMGQLNDTLNNYKNSEEYSKHINEIKAVHLAKIKSLIQKIRLSDAHTNQQKTFYTEQEEDVINSYIITLNWFIGLFTIYYIFDQRSNIRPVMIAETIFLISIIFLKPLLYFSKVDLQFQFGYDPMKSKVPWILWVFFILLLIWLWVYLDLFTMFAYSTFTPIGPARPPGTIPPVLIAIGTTLYGFTNSIMAFMIQMYQNMNVVAGRLSGFARIPAIPPIRAVRARR